MDNAYSLIKDVAIYLRKSRVEETAKDLAKHRDTLIEICEKNKWNYMIYQEEGSSNSSSINTRDKMVQLLNDLDDDLYDAVMVIDQDRLSRGGSGDSDRIKEVLLRSDTLLLIGDRVYNLSEDHDEMAYEMNAFIARMEYRIIKKRLRRGKIIGSKQGRWTNGVPPIPYKYNKDTQELFIDPVEYILYRRILDDYITGGKSSNDIAYALNKDGKLTRKGKPWSNKTLLDLLKDQTHTGKIIVGKTKQVYKQVYKRKLEKYVKEYIEVKRPQDEWKEYPGLHKAVKTDEEHEAVLRRISELTLQPTKNKGGYNDAKLYPLSKLVKCGLCGCTLRLHQRDNSSNVNILKCWYKDSFGNKCKNRYGNIDAILDAINEHIITHVQNIEIDMESHVARRAAEIEEQLVICEQGLRSNEQSLTRIYEAYEKGIYADERFIERKSIVEGEINKLKNMVKALKEERLSLTTEVSAGKLDVLRSFEDIIANGNLSYEELNSLYRSILKNIYYTRAEDGTITLKLEYK